MSSIDQLTEEFKNKCRQELGEADLYDPDDVDSVIEDIDSAMEEEDDPLTLGKMVLFKRWLREFEERWENAQ
jgi:hypothetical protein